jgi:hypothetical protein
MWSLTDVHPTHRPRGTPENRITRYGGIPISRSEGLTGRCDPECCDGSIPYRSVGRSLSLRHRRLAYIATWACVFALMSAAQGVGDRHRGQFVPFWRQACQQDRSYACRYLAQLQTNYCRAGAAWSCNALGILQDGKNGDRPAAIASMQRGCDLGFPPACANVAALNGDGALVTGPPPLEDLAILLRGSKGPIADRTSASLYTLACDQGWPGSCDRSP